VLTPGKFALPEKWFWDHFDLSGFRVRDLRTGLWELYRWKG
jgi:hypothetical protein